MTVIEFDGVPFDPVGTAAVRGASAAMHESSAFRESSAVRESPEMYESSAVRESQAVNESPAVHENSAVHERLAVHRSPAARQTSAGHETPRMHEPPAVQEVATSTAVAKARPQTPGPLTEIRSGVVAAHRAALTAQVALQRAIWQRAVHPQVPGTDHGHGGPSISGARIAAAPEWTFKPLARTTRTSLDRTALARLTEGDVADVFGYRRSGVESVARLAAAGPLVLTDVVAIELRGGTGNGRLVAHFDGDTRTAAVQAAEVFALFTGMQLCLSRSTLVSEPGTTESRTGTVEFVVREIDLVPRPHVTGTATIAGSAPLEVTVTVTEPAGAGVGPGAAVPGLLLNEFHMTHLARGDQAIAMGHEFAEYTGVRATRLPTGGLLLVDRVIEFDGARGKLDAATYRTEYDSPADSWYYGDTANESMPHFVYMETSLQAALLMGYYAGPTLTQPGVTLSLRNLGGTATVLRQVDLRDKTIEQTSRLLSTTILPGSSLQNFDYTLSVDGEPFYTGETMFGYFSDEALANQTGLDAGRSVPTWLDEHPQATRTIDVAARRADPDARLCARRTLALIDRIDVVDGGGKYGAGYLHSLREIDPADWYFARHFHLDPVIPGSLGVESVIHAIQEWMLDAGFADTIGAPVFRIPSDIAFSWRYRGQFLPTDATVRLEAHIKEIRRGASGVTVIADGSLWKPGLRIYELVDLAIELGEREERP
ncbi:beta-hydroxydecanoyl-ACP dehydratase [Nocardia sp. NPDC049526]|uniref:beta-hydroxydecanoyl-ACP dehydratase n=1 Tax=Nocardia sp. NPDC049526 TaxID=3364316 RepID=UPI0037B3D0FC